MAQGVIRRMLEAAERALSAPEERRVPDAEGEERIAPPLLRMRSVVWALALGVATGLAIAALLGRLNLEGYLVLVAQCAMVGILVRLWVGWTAPRPGRALRILRVLGAGVLLCAGGVGIHSLASDIDRFDPAVMSWSRWLSLLLLASLLLAGVPAFLLAAWAERQGLRPGWAWWASRGLASAAFGAPISALAFCLQMDLTHGLQFSYTRLWEPLELLWAIGQDPVYLLFALGPTTLLALVLGADSRWRVGGGSGPPGVPGRPAPADPTPTADSPRDRGLDFVSYQA